MKKDSVDHQAELDKIRAKYKNWTKEEEKNMAEKTQSHLQNQATEIMKT